MTFLPLASRWTVRTPTTHTDDLDVKRKRGVGWDLPPGALCAVREAGGDDEMPRVARAGPHEAVFPPLDHVVRPLHELEGCAVVFAGFDLLVGLSDVHGVVHGDLDAVLDGVRAVGGLLYDLDHLRVWGRGRRAAVEEGLDVEERRREEGRRREGGEREERGEQ